MKILQEAEIMEEGNNSNWIKCIISILFLLISINVFLLKLNPLPGYVPSFYKHIPLLFWASSVIIFFSASILLIKFRSLHIKYVYMLFFLILLNNAIVLFSPYICGAYLMSGGDLPTHGGMVLDIFRTSKIDFNINFYPLTHLLAFSISSISNIDYMDSVKILSPIFSLLLPLYFYILAKEITDNRFVQNLTFLISSTFYVSSLFSDNSITTPRALSLLMLPFLFFLFIKSARYSKKPMSFVLCLLLSFSAYVFFHPLTSILLVFSFALLYILEKSMKMQFSHHGSLFFICAVLAYLIYLTKIWVRPVQNIYHFLLGYKILLGYFVDIKFQLSKLEITGFDFVSFFIKTFGHQTILLLLSISSVIFILLGKTRKNFKAWVLTLFSFQLASGILFFISIVMPSSMNVAFWRFLPFIILFSPILSSLSLSTLHKRSLVIPVLLFLFINSLLTVYPSPYIHQANSQVTIMDLSGSQWLLNHKNSNVGLSGYFGSGITIRIISGLIPYSQFYYERYNVWYDEKSLMQDHLGYEKNSYIWDAFMEERYLIISKFDIVAYTEIYKNIGRLSIEDIEKVKNDNSALCVYNNGEYTVFYIYRHMNAEKR